MITTDVAIIGGGPSGLMLAIELGCRGITCTVLEEDPTDPQLPKANATSARTMEHFRRRGFSHRIRALGLPPDHPQDVVYTTRVAQHELTRFRIPSAGEAAQQASFGDYGGDAWPTPELPHRAQQMYIEPVLRSEAEKYPSVTVRFGARAVAVSDRGDDVRVDVMGVDGQALPPLVARYVVGCDGPRSLVRQTMGFGYSGHGGERREFLGGQMLSIYFRASGLYEQLNKPRAWQYWAVNPEQRCVLCAINGVDTFVMIVQLAEGQALESLDIPDVLRKSMGLTFAHDVIALTPWNAGLALVAERFRQGRLFIAGDAAHLFTPTGGMGYNTSVDDAVNLGWKLAHVLRGQAPAALLDTYQAERQPMAYRNTAFARRMADGIGRLRVGAEVEAPGAEGEQARQRLAVALAAHVTQEFNIPGLQLGVRYTGSSIVAVEDALPPPDEPNCYVPSGYPGGRAPHVVTSEGSLLDHFGIDHTLLVLTEISTEAWQSEAQRIGLPLAVLRWQQAATRELYGADLVLVRPDHHIAWRGPAHTDPAIVLARATACFAAPA